MLRGRNPNRVTQGAETLNLGRDLFAERGCVGCHRYEGFDRETDALVGAPDVPLAIRYFAGACGVCMIDNTHVVVLSGTGNAALATGARALAIVWLASVSVI